MSTLEHLGSLITYKSKGKDVCLGSLMHFPGHGVYDAAIGKVDVSPEDADTHNRLLDAAMLDGLDKNCEVGMHGTFYLTKDATQCWQVTTFAGTVVAPREDVLVNGKAVTFGRKGRTYQGRTQKDATCFNFRRVR